MNYTVYHVGGKKDGQILGIFETEKDALDFAKKYTEENADFFDPVCGGVGIEDANGRVIEW